MKGPPQRTFERQHSLKSDETLEIFAGYIQEYFNLQSLTKEIESKFDRFEINGLTARDDLAQVEAKLNSLQCNKIDACDISEVSSGKDEVKSRRKELNREMERLFERISEMFAKFKKRPHEPAKNRNHNDVSGKNGGGSTSSDDDNNGGPGRRNGNGNGPPRPPGRDNSNSSYGVTNNGANSSSSHLPYHPGPGSHEYEINKNPISSNNINSKLQSNLHPSSSGPGSRLNNVSNHTLLGAEANGPGGGSSQTSSSSQQYNPNSYINGSYSGGGPGSMSMDSQQLQGPGPGSSNSGSGGNPNFNQSGLYNTNSNNMNQNRYNQSMNQPGIGPGRPGSSSNKAPLNHNHNSNLLNQTTHNIGMPMNHHNMNPSSSSMSSGSGLQAPQPPGPIGVNGPRGHQPTHPLYQTSNSTYGQGQQRGNGYTIPGPVYDPNGPGKPFYGPGPGHRYSTSGNGVHPLYRV